MLAMEISYPNKVRFLKKYLIIGIEWQKNKEIDMIVVFTRILLP